ncbi:MAG TPA: hypothetical protein DEQ32_11615 [Gammaproteobacteria bacterium]|nr:hypothetical protein [Gammaproteobacteria bacterium]
MLVESSSAARIIKKAVDERRLDYAQFVLSEGQRIDIVAANYYGDARYWWVICAASGIGWVGQVPPGTLLKIPTSLNAVANLVA